MNRQRQFIALILVAFFTSGTFCDDSTSQEIRPADDAPQPMTPEDSAKAIRLPQGFRIELVASEPLVQDPSCIAFDEEGRMFACELHGYNIEGHLDVQKLNKTGVLDRTVRRVRWEFQDGEIAHQAAKLQRGVVKMLVDSNGDGVMDQAHTWADDLPPCYGVVPVDGGIIVVCAPDIVFLADQDGDGRPDHRKTLFTGFRTETLERGINNPRWGVDNWIYVGAGGKGGTITGPNLKQPVELAHSDFRIKPDGSAIEPVTGRVGTFGMTINDVGDRFPATGGRPAMYALPLPYRYLTRNPFVATPATNHYAATYNRGYRISKPHPWRVKRQQDPAWVKFYGPTETNSNFFSGGCSNEFYGDSLFPATFRGNIFYCEPSLNMVHRCIVTRDGPGYSGVRHESEQESEFLASTDQWFRPMNLRVGPRGALYVVDMYREIIEDYSAIPRFLQQQYGLDKGRDFGRIWRLVPDDFQWRPISKMTKWTDNELVKAIADPSAWRRKTAQRLLIARQSKSVVNSLSDLIAESQSPNAAIHAMHTLEGLDLLSIDNVKTGLQHGHYGVRVHALRLSERWLDTEEALLEAALRLADDSDPSVRLQLALTVGQCNDSRAAGFLLDLAKQHGKDRWMGAAILSSAPNHADELLSGLLQEPTSLGQATLLLRSISATVAGRRDAVAISKVLSVLIRMTEELQIECLAGFSDGLAIGDRPLPESPDHFAAIVSLMKSDSQTVRDLATRLASKLPGVDESTRLAIYRVAIERATNEGNNLDERLNAIDSLASAPSELLLPVAQNLLSVRQPVSIQLAVIKTVAESTDSRVGSVLLRNWTSLTPKVRHEIMKSIGGHANRLPALLMAIKDGRVAAGEIDQRTQLQLVENKDAQIAANAKKIFRSSTPGELQARLARYAEALSNRRDSEHGRLVFEKHCSACHKVGDVGHDVGPNLGTILNRPDETILMEILAPNDKIDPEYRSYLITTSDGRTFNGVLASESPTSITLRQEKGLKQNVLRQQIDEIKASEISLMPSNLHEQVSPQDAADLIEYLRRSLKN